MENTVSFVKQNYPDEQRTLLLPEQIKLFKEKNINVIVEEGIGQGIGIPDSAYTQQGAILVDHRSAWTRCNIVYSYKTPVEEEYQYFREGLILTGAFHLEGNIKLAKRMIEKKITVYSYEYFKTKAGIFPAMIAASEVSGKLAVINGAYFLQKHIGGCGTLLSNIPNAPAAKVIVIGYGNAGGAAIRLASAMGANVLVYGTNKERLRKFYATVTGNVRTEVLSKDSLLRELPNTDLVIGAIQISTYDTPAIIGKEELKVMKKGSVIVDVTCGYGKGYIPSCEIKTTPQNPTRIVNGVIHSSISTLPSLVPATSMPAISGIIVPYLVELGDSLINNIFSEDFLHLSKEGMVLDRGNVVNGELSRHLKFNVLEN